MKRKIYFDNGIILGDYMRTVVNILPSLESKFTQRKCYDEYYFKSQEVKLSLDQVDRLSKELSINITSDELCIYLAF